MYGIHLGFEFRTYSFINKSFRLLLTATETTLSRYREYISSTAMTLIAHINYKELPILIGDAIISSRSSRTDFVLPLQQGPFSPVSEWSGHIVDLQRKIHLIGDSVAIAWSGRCATATSYIKELEALLHISIDIFSTVEEFFYKLENDPHASDVTFILVYVAHGEWHRFQHNAHSFDSPIYGEICGGGSGFWPFS